MKAAGRALRMIPPPPTYTVNWALGRWTDPGPVSAFAARDPIHIVQCTLRIKPNMFMFMFKTPTPTFPQKKTMPAHVVGSQPAKIWVLGK